MGKIGVKRDLTKAIHYLELAVAHGNAKYGNINLGRAYYDINHKSDRAISYYKKAVEAGNPAGNLLIGETYRAEEDYQQARVYFEEAFKDGIDLAGEYLLSMIFHEEGFTRDLSLMKEYANRLLEINEDSDSAVYYLAVIGYLETKNVDEFYDKLLLAREKGSLLAKFDLGDKGLFDKLKGSVEGLLARLDRLKGLAPSYSDVLPWLSFEQKPGQKFFAIYFEIFKELFTGSLSYNFFGKIIYLNKFPEYPDNKETLDKLNKIRNGLTKNRFFQPDYVALLVESSYLKPSNIYNLSSLLKRIKDSLDKAELKAPNKEKRYLYLIADPYNYEISRFVLEMADKTYDAIGKAREQAKRGYEARIESTAKAYDKEMAREEASSSNSSDYDYDCDPSESSSSSFPYETVTDDDGNEMSINIMTGRGDDGNYYTEDPFTGEWTSVDDGD